MSTLDDDEDALGSAPTAAIAGNTPALVPALPPLSNIWFCPKIRQFMDGNKKMWLCEWCPTGSLPFTGWNATKCLYHVCKIAGQGIRPCKGLILPEYAQCYRDFRESKIINAETREGKLFTL